MSVELAVEIPVLQEITAAIVRERNIKRLLEQVLAILERRMGMIRGTFTLLEGDILTIAASHGLDAEEIALGKYHLGEGVTGHVAETGRPHIVPDIRKDRRFLNRTGARDEKRQTAFICVPLVHLEQVIGTLSIDRYSDGNADVLAKDVALLEIVANVTADAASALQQEREEREKLLEENRNLRNLLSGNPGEMIGNCREMRAVYEQIHQVAASEATVLVRGASGTGKELVARAIQKFSPRKDKPFITLNCAALPENLVESELFGHEKGSFTGAVSRRIGRAEAADGGTLFLDEIGDLTIPMQVKLLRFLQERTFSRVGSNEELHSNVRFIAATSRNLEDLMAKKLFREDLYYRLSVFPIQMPDLAHRTGDIILLAEHFMGKMNLKYGKSVTKLSTPAVNMLLAYRWPGNVRELENCIERAVLTAAGDTIRSYNLPPSLQNEDFDEESPDNYAPRKTLDEQLRVFEKRVMLETLARHNGNRSAAGRELGISPRMMNYRLNRLGIGKS